MNDHHSVAGESTTSATANQDMVRVAPKRRSKGARVSSSRSNGNARYAAKSISSGSQGPSRSRPESANNTLSNGPPSEVW